NERRGVESGGQLAQVRVVDGQRRSVAAGLVVRGGAEKRDVVAEGGVERRMPRRRGDIDGAALRRLREHVAVRVEEIGGDAEVRQGGEERRRARPVRAAARVELDVGYAGYADTAVAPHEGDHASHGRAAIEV